MLAQVDLIISFAAVACVVVGSGAVTSEHFKGIGCDITDVVVFVTATLAYWLLVQSRSRQRFKLNTKAAKKGLASDCLLVETIHNCGACDVDLLTDQQQEKPITREEENKYEFDMHQYAMPMGACVVDEVPKERKQEPLIPQEEEKYEFDVDQHVMLMQRYASERNISETMRMFRLVQKSGCRISSLMYNTVLLAWVNCGNVQAAEDWMEEIEEAGMSDETSFHVLINALLMSCALDKAKALMNGAREVGIPLSISVYNELLGVYARENLVNDGLSLLEEMYTEGVQPTRLTLEAIVKLLDSSRAVDPGFDRLNRIIQNYNIEAHVRGHCLQLPTSHHRTMHRGTIGLEPSSVSVAELSLPRLAAVVKQAEVATSRLCAHEVHATGDLACVKAARRTLKQHGFMDKDEWSAWPLNGFWETDHGLTVIIEGKRVRWSQQRASRLRFTRGDRCACMLTLYGEPAHGWLVPPTTAPGSTKALRWDNGDVWHSYDGLVVAQNTLFSQTMSKARRDEMQDEAYRARTREVLSCVSKQRIGVPNILEDIIIQFLGKDLYYIQVHFESKWNPACCDADQAEADFFKTISCRHPRVGLRHCWAEENTDFCGQRTLVNGEEVNEDIFCRHLQAVRR